MNIHAKLFFMFALACIVGCAAAMPPQDLVTARASYARASQGPAAGFDPADIHAASESLAAAERSFTQSGASQETSDLAYVADRRAQTAEARAIAMQAAQQQQQTLGRMHDAETVHAQATSAQLGRANMQIALQGQALQSQNQQIPDRARARQ